jgi:hypothetical protein
MFKYLDGDIPAAVNESTFTLQKYDGAFSEIPSTLDVGANTVSTTGISSFSDWTLFGLLSPTAAPASVSGRVLTFDGRPVSNSVVSLADIEGNIVSARTGTFGYFTVDVHAGQTYVLSIRHKRYTFATQLIQVTDNVTGLELRANP